MGMDRCLPSGVDACDTKYFRHVVITGAGPDREQDVDLQARDARHSGGIPRNRCYDRDLQQKVDSESSNNNVRIHYSPRFRDPLPMSKCRYPQVRNRSFLVTLGHEGAISMRTSNMQELEQSVTCSTCCALTVY